MIDRILLEKMGVSQRRSALYSTNLEALLAKYQIDTPLRISHFLAQVLHESAMLRHNVENLNYSAEGLRRTFSKYFPTQSLASQYQRQPRKIGSRVYANRMGNSDELSGEGYHYRGRGLIQLTGKNNYTMFSQWSGEDVLDIPSLISDEFSVLSAIFYWDTNHLNTLADQDDLTALTRRINGGRNGIEHRQDLLNKAKRLLDLTTLEDENLYQVVATSLNLRNSAEITNHNIL